MCPTASEPRSSNLFDPAYYEDLMARPFREGTIGESPVLPGTGMFMPVGTGADQGQGPVPPRRRRSSTPRSAPAASTARWCAPTSPSRTPFTRSTTCSSPASRASTPPRRQRESLRAKVYPLAERVRESYRQDKADRTFSDVVAEAAKGLDADKSMRRHLDDVVTMLATFPVARTRPFFDSMEKEVPGTRRPLLRGRRPVEVHGLPPVRRGLWRGRPDRRRPDRRRPRRRSKSSSRS